MPTQFNSLLERLTSTAEEAGSPLSYNNGADIPTNPQAIQGNATSIHSNDSEGGGVFADPANSFSLNGSEPTVAQDIYNAYNDGDAANPLPTPSLLDRNNGYTPPTYRDNKPAGSQSFPSFS
jgi:hypothetical protein